MQGEKITYRSGCAPVRLTWDDIITSNPEVIGKCLPNPNPSFYPSFNININLNNPNANPNPNPNPNPNI
jgi:hypothetical protein